MSNGTGGVNGIRAGVGKPQGNSHQVAESALNALREGMTLLSNSQGEPGFLGREGNNQHSNASQSQSPTPNTVSVASTEQIVSFKSLEQASPVQGVSPIKHETWFDSDAVILSIKGELEAILTETKSTKSVFGGGAPGRDLKPDEKAAKMVDLYRKYAQKVDCFAVAFGEVLASRAASHSDVFHAFFEKDLGGIISQKQTMRDRFSDGFAHRVEGLLGKNTTTPLSADALKTAFSNLMHVQFAQHDSCLTSLGKALETVCRDISEKIDKNDPRYLLVEDLVKILTSPTHSGFETPGSGYHVLCDAMMSTSVLRAIVPASLASVKVFLKNLEETYQQDVGRYVRGFLGEHIPVSSLDQVFFSYSMKADILDALVPKKNAYSLDELVVGAVEKREPSRIAELYKKIRYPDIPALLQDCETRSEVDAFDYVSTIGQKVVAVMTDVSARYRMTDHQRDTIGRFLDLSQALYFKHMGQLVVHEKGIKAQRVRELQTAFTAQLSYQESMLQLAPSDPDTASETLRRLNAQVQDLYRPEDPDYQDRVDRVRRLSEHVLDAYRARVESGLPDATVSLNEGGYDDQLREIEMRMDAYYRYQTVFQTMFGPDTTLTNLFDRVPDVLGYESQARAIEIKIEGLSQLQRDVAAAKLQTQKTALMVSLTQCADTFGMPREGVETDVRTRSTEARDAFMTRYRYKATYHGDIQALIASGTADILAHQTRDIGTIITAYTTAMAQISVVQCSEYTAGMSAHTVTEAILKALETEGVTRLNAAEASYADALAEVEDELEGHPTARLEALVDNTKLEVHQRLLDFAASGLQDTPSGTTRLVFLREAQTRLGSYFPETAKKELVDLQHLSAKVDEARKAYLEIDTQFNQAVMLVQKALLRMQHCSGIDLQDRIATTGVKSPDFGSLSFVQRKHYLQSQTQLLRQAAVDLSTLTDAYETGHNTITDRAVAKHANRFSLEDCLRVFDDTTKTVSNHPEKSQLRDRLVAHAESLAALIGHEQEVRADKLMRLIHDDLNKAAQADLRTFKHALDQAYTKLQAFDKGFLTSSSLTALQAHIHATVGLANTVLSFGPTSDQLETLELWQSQIDGFVAQAPVREREGDFSYADAVSPSTTSVRHQVENLPTQSWRKPFLSHIANYERLLREKTKGFLLLKEKQQQLSGRLTLALRESGLDEAATEQLVQRIIDTKAHPSDKMRRVSYVVTLLEKEIGLAESAIDAKERLSVLTDVLRDLYPIGKNRDRRAQDLIVGNILAKTATEAQKRHPHGHRSLVLRTQVELLEARIAEIQAAQHQAKQALVTELADALHQLVFADAPSSVKAKWDAIQQQDVAYQKIWNNKKYTDIRGEAAVQAAHHAFQLRLKAAMANTAVEKRTLMEHLNRVLIDYPSLTETAVPADIIGDIKKSVLTISGHRDYGTTLEAEVVALPTDEIATYIRQAVGLRAAEAVLARGHASLEDLRSAYDALSFASALPAPGFEDVSLFYGRVTNALRVQLEARIVAQNTLSVLVQTLDAMTFATIDPFDSRSPEEVLRGEWEQIATQMHALDVLEARPENQGFLNVPEFLEAKQRVALRRETHIRSLWPYAQLVMTEHLKATILTFPTGRSWSDTLTYARERVQETIGQPDMSTVVSAALSTVEPAFSEWDWTSRLALRDAVAAAAAALMAWRPGDTVGFAMHEQLVKTAIATVPKVGSLETWACDEIFKANIRRLNQHQQSLRAFTVPTSGISFDARWQAIASQEQALVALQRVFPVATRTAEQKAHLAAIETFLAGYEAASSLEVQAMFSALNKQVLGTHTTFDEVVAGLGRGIVKLPARCQVAMTALLDTHISPLKGDITARLAFKAKVNEARVLQTRMGDINQSREELRAMIGSLGRSPEGLRPADHLSFAGADGFDTVYGKRAEDLVAALQARLTELEQQAQTLADSLTGAREDIQRAAAEAQKESKPQFHRKGILDAKITRLTQAIDKAIATFEEAVQELPETAELRAGRSALQTLKAETLTLVKIYLQTMVSTPVSTEQVGLQEAIDNPFSDFAFLASLSDRIDALRHAPDRLGTWLSDGVKHAAAATVADYDSRISALRTREGQIHAFQNALHELTFMAPSALSDFTSKWEDISAKQKGYQGVLESPDYFSILSEDPRDPQMQEAIVAFEFRKQQAINNQEPERNFLITMIGAQLMRLPDHFVWADTVNGVVFPSEDPAMTPELKPLREAAIAVVKATCIADDDLRDAVTNRVTARLSLDRAEGALDGYPWNAMSLSEGDRSIRSAIDSAMSAKRNCGTVDKFTDFDSELAGRLETLEGRYRQNVAARDRLLTDFQGIIDTPFPAPDPGDDALVAFSKKWQGIAQKRELAGRLAEPHRADTGTGFLLDPQVAAKRAAVMAHLVSERESMATNGAAGILAINQSLLSDPAPASVDAVCDGAQRLLSDSVGPDSAVRSSFQGLLAGFRRGWEPLRGEIQARIELRNNVVTANHVLHLLRSRQVRGIDFGVALTPCKLPAPTAQTPLFRVFDQKMTEQVTAANHAWQTYNERVDAFHRAIGHARLDSATILPGSALHQLPDMDTLSGDTPLQRARAKWTALQTSGATYTTAKGAADYLFKTDPTEPGPDVHPDVAAVNKVFLDAFAEKRDNVEPEAAAIREALDRDLAVYVAGEGGEPDLDTLMSGTLADMGIPVGEQTTQVLAKLRDLGHAGGIQNEYQQRLALFQALRGVPLPTTEDLEAFQRCLDRLPNQGLYPKCDAMLRELLNVRKREVFGSMAVAAINHSDNLSRLTSGGETSKIFEMAQQWRALDDGFHVGPDHNQKKFRMTFDAYFQAYSTLSESTPEDYLRNLEASYASIKDKLPPVYQGIASRALAEISHRNEPPPLCAYVISAAVGTVFECLDVVADTRYIDVPASGTTQSVPLHKDLMPKPAAPTVTGFEDQDRYSALRSALDRRAPEILPDTDWPTVSPAEFVTLLGWMTLSSDGVQAPSIRMDEGRRDSHMINVEEQTLFLERMSHECAILREYCATFVINEEISWADFHTRVWQKIQAESDVLIQKYLKLRLQVFLDAQLRGV